MDKLSLLRKKEFKISENITIHQPTLGEIQEHGEEEYYSLLSLLTATPSDVKSILFDSGLDYEEVSDFELFIMFTKNISQDKSKILLGEVDLSKLHILLDKKDNESVLCKLDNNNEIKIIIDSFIYNLIADKLRNLHQLKKNTEKAFNEYTKQALIEEDRDKRKRKKEFNSVLEPLIISGVCCADFPYDFSTVWELPIGTFLKGITQTQRYNNVKNLMTGIYTGNIDVTKISKKDMSWV